MAASNSLEEDIIKHKFGIATWTPPATYYLALFKSSTGLETGSAAQEVQTSATAGYTRQAFAATWAGSGDPGAVTNTGAHTFTSSGSGWEDVTHVGLCKSATPGTNDVDSYLPLDSAITNITVGSSVNFAAGVLRFETT